MSASDREPAGGQDVESPAAPREGVGAAGSDTTHVETRHHHGPHRPHRNKAGRAAGFGLLVGALGVV